MNIILASDENYLNPAKVLLSSLAKNNKGFVAVYLLHAGIDPQKRERFAEECTGFAKNIDVSFVAVDDELFSDMPTSFGLPHTAYYRFAVPGLLPASVDRALYLDCDIIVNRSIQELYDTDFADKLFVACEDIGVSVLGKYRFLTIFDRLKKELPNGRYFNSGVLLINMPLARRTISLDDVFEVVGKHRNAITFSDQDVLNFMYGMHTKYVDYKVYNMGAGYVTPENEEWVTENSAIIHYYGAQTDKPWLDEGREKSESAVNRLWWKYASGSQGMRGSL